MELNFLDPTTGEVIAALYTYQGKITIGRSSHCDIVIPTRYSSVSSHHATISSTGDSVKVIDGDGHKPSTNGLFINGCRQQAGVWLALSPGMALSLGKPGLSSSINLVLSADSENWGSSQSTYHAAKAAPSVMPSIGMTPEQLQLDPRTQASNNKVSEGMKLRLLAIDEYLGHGYTLQKDFGAFPVFIGSDTRRHNISVLKNPAGFSWIAFFFPFAVCTQIREWGYFYVSAFLFAIASLVAVATGYDPGVGAGVAISLMYGSYFPYLRHMALAKNVQEISSGMSIVLGIILSVVAAIPSFAIEIVAHFANN